MVKIPPIANVQIVIGYALAAVQTFTSETFNKQFQTENKFNSNLKTQTKMKLKEIFLAAIMMCIINITSAQITFQKTFGGTNMDEGQSVQQTTDGGYIIAGSTFSFGAGTVDVYLIKTNANGDTLWTKTFGGTGDDLGNSVEQTTDGGYIIAGYTYGFGAGDVDVYLIRTNSIGDILWTKTFGGTDQDFGYSVKQTNDSGYIIAGTTRSFGAGFEDIYLIKTNANGDTLWTKTFGGTGEDIGYSVQQTSDGGYLIGGNSTSFGAGAKDVYLIKTDVAGNIVWTKVFGGAANDIAQSVQQTSDGGYIIAGGANSFSLSTDVYLIKTNAAGDTLWTKTFGGTSYDRGESVQQTNDGGYIIAGIILGCSACPADVYLIRTNATGDTLWTKTFGSTNEDFGFSVKQTTDGGYIIAGWTLSFGAGIYDLYLIKTDADGNSGCNQATPVTVVTTPATQVANPATMVSSGGTVTAPATAVGSGGSDITLCTTVGIQEITTAISFLISPNPTSNNFTITFPNTITTGTIEIYNVLGEKVFEETMHNSSAKQIHLTNISAGIYFVNVYDREKYYCKKLIVE